MALGEKFLINNLEVENITDEKVVLAGSGGEDAIINKQNLLNDLTTSLLKPILETQIGDIYFNFNTAYQDQLTFEDGVFEYKLCNGDAVDQSTHPLLYAKYPNLLNFEPAEFEHDGKQYGGFVRHVAVGNSDGKPLGSAIMDSVQEHQHTITYLNTPGGLSFAASSTIRAQNYNNTGGVINARVDVETASKHIYCQVYQKSKVVLDLENLSTRKQALLQRAKLPRRLLKS